jgi:hypothetical protein
MAFRSRRPKVAEVLDAPPRAGHDGVRGRRAPPARAQARAPIRDMPERATWLPLSTVRARW